MRIFLTYLLSLGVFAGIGMGALGNPVHHHAEVACSSLDDHHPDHIHGGEHLHDVGELHCENSSECPDGSDCPDGSHGHHHHTGPCCAPAAMIAGDFSSMRLALLDESHVLFSALEDTLPDPPVLSEDKPPLI